LIPLRNHELGALTARAGRVPYRIALFLVQNQVKSVCPGARVWARNSFLTDAFRPFKSDLDITIWLPSHTNDGIERELLRALRRIKRIFPALGEANVYCEEGFRRFIRFANQFELRRDPPTCLRFQIPHLPVDIRNAQVSVYLLRMLESNLHLLRSGWDGQQVKWQYHLRQVQFEPESVLGNPDPIRGILNCALGCSLATNKSIIEQVYSYLHGGEASEIVQVLFPNRFCYLELPRALLEGQVRELFLAQTAWEIWGLYGQQLLYEQKMDLGPHLRRLLGWLAQIEDERATDLRTGLEQLVAVVEASNLPNPSDQVRES